MEIEPKDVYSTVKELLKSEGFTLQLEDVKDGFWDLHARKSNLEIAAVGKVRDVDVLVAGTKGKFEVQLRAGIWGRDLIVPVIESIATLGVAAAVDIHSAHNFEEKLWEQIVHKIDPTLRICPRDGLLFKSEEELKGHLKMHEATEMLSGYEMGYMGYGGMGYGFPIWYGRDVPYLPTVDHQNHN
jgi:hypothetical protein